MRRSNPSLLFTVISLLLIGLSVGGTSPLGATPMEVSGTPTIVTGDTLVLQGYQVRLFGIDAPELGQDCDMHGRSYDCGYIAATALMDLTAGARVRCEIKQQAELTLIAICFAGDYDLSEGMVYTGWALALPGETSRYRAFEEDARKAQRGLWRGEFIAPWDWEPGQASTDSK